MFVKVCGLKSKEQIDKAIELGFDAIGVVVYPKSRRYCTDDEAIELAKYAKGKILTFVVSINYSEVEGVAEYFDYIQIYEKKEIDNLAFSSKNHPKDTECRFFVFDASLGSGEFKVFPNWLKGINQKLIVAGGLNKENVAEVIRDLKPFGVDVSSGVEIDGIKDVSLMEEFISSVRNAE